MPLEFGRRKPSVASSDVRRDSSANFALDATVGAYEMSATVNFQDYNKQTKSYTFDLVATSPATALSVLVGTVLPVFGINSTGNLQGMQMLSYTLSIHQEIGFEDNPQPVYGHQREMFGVIQFPVGGKLVDHFFPTPTDAVLDASDKKYLNMAAVPLANYIALFTGATPALQIRGQKPGTPQRAFIRHKESQTQTETIKIG